MGANGLILGTTDGGATWSTQSSSGPYLWHVTCVDAKHVWAVGPRGVLMRSIDGGRTWQAEQVTGVDMTASGGGGIAFADAEHGWIASGDAVRVSSDGGATWALQYRHKGFRLRSVACADAQHVWAVGARERPSGEEPVVVATTDGGVNWTSEPVGKASGQTSAFGLPPSLSTVACSGSLHVWAASDQAGTVVLSRDGGRSWQVRRFSGALDGYSLAAADAEHLFLTTSGQPVMVSDDGGVTWAASGRSSWLGDGPAHVVAAVSIRTP